MRKRAVVALAAAGAAVVAIFVLAGAAGAGAGPGPAPAKIDLSTDAAVKAYLDSLGVDSTTTVVQRGLNNYAGPRCPGVGWTCTTATSVVQIALGNGTNIYEGNPEFFANGDPGFPLPDTFVPLSPPTGTPCMVTQTTTESGQNHARCFQRSITNPAALTVMITQTNELGDNFVQVHQQIRQRDGAVQSGHEDVDVSQENVEGDNHLHVISQISQHSSETTETIPPLQEQDGTFDSDLDQDTETGNNIGTLLQELKQDGSATGPDTTVQHQVADEFGDVDQFAEEDEITILSNGDGQGFSQFFAHQSKSQHLTGPGVQAQDDPGSCCGAGTQTGDPQQTSMNILQESDQRASQGDAEQSLTLLGSCNSTGDCELTHHARNDEDSITAMNEGTGPTFLTTHCESTEFQGEGSGDCVSTEDPPFEP